MLTELYIENIAVIEKTNIRFSPGLNVLTGETGAGKSIVIDAISAVLGRRTSRELIRSSAESAYVSATFSLPGEAARNKLFELGFECGDELIIEREFTMSGRNNCRVNARPASVAVLREIGRLLIGIHGQHESYELMSPDLHIGYIDAYSGLGRLLDSYRAEYARYKEVSKKLSSLKSQDADRETRADILRFQISELESAQLEPGEYESLTEERMTLSGVERLRELFAAASYCMLGDSSELPGALTLVSDASSQIEAAQRLMPQALVLSERIQSLSYELEDVSGEIESVLSNLEADPQRLEYVQQRLDLISRLSKKYGETAEDMLRFLEDAKSRLSEIESMDSNCEILEQEQRELLENCTRLACELSEKRREGAKLFCAGVTAQMRELDMPSARIEVSQINCPLCENGCDLVELIVSTNAGEPPKPVAKIASGGELSRMMLAIKTVLSDIDPTDTLIFDEIDSGISGSAAGRVGQKLRLVSSGCQVLCVTHLPQIASLADSHYLISKSESQGRTYTDVTLLDHVGRVDELARIIGGVDVAESAREYARELLRRPDETEN